MFSVLFDSMREVVESAVGTVFFLFSFYFAIPFLYGGISVSPQTTLQSLFFAQPIDWWWFTISGAVIDFFEWVFSQVSPLVVPKVFELIQIGGLI